MAAHLISLVAQADASCSFRVASSLSSCTLVFYGTRLTGIALPLVGAQRAATSQPQLELLTVAIFRYAFDLEKPLRACAVFAEPPGQKVTTKTGTCRLEVMNF